MMRNNSIPFIHFLQHFLFYFSFFFFLLFVSLIMASHALIVRVYQQYHSMEVLHIIKSLRRNFRSRNSCANVISSISFSFFFSIVFENTFFIANSCSSIAINLWFLLFCRRMQKLFITNGIYLFC